MVEKIYGWRAPPIFIEEWMQTVPGLSRVRLAERMGVSPGTVTKKLQEPHKIDGEWLGRFAEAIGLSDPTLLYKNPNAPTPDELLKGLTEAQRREVVSFVDFVRNKKNGTDG